MPPNRPGSPSRSSTASWTPVEAPDGTAARPTEPSDRTTSTSTVGLPRESRISRASIPSMKVLTSGPSPSAWRRRSAPSSSPAPFAFGFDVDFALAFLASTGRSSKTVTPGSSRPSRNSSDAPPPVEMWVIRSARPCWVTAATESPPPTMTVAPASARSASIRATALVPWANDGISKTPSGPFQNTVRASDSASTIRSWLALPRSTMCHEAGIFSAWSVLYSVPRVTSLATMTSTGRTTRTSFLAAVARIRRASSTRSGSARLLPIALPCASRKVFAIPPPRTSMSTNESRWSMTPILSDTFAPPRIAANGRSGFSSSFESISISRSIRSPA